VFETAKHIFIITEYTNSQDLMQVMQKRKCEPFIEP